MTTSYKVVSFKTTAMNDAYLRSYLAEWYTALSQIGWTQTDDTNQMDISTVTVANLTTALSTTKYTIHYFNDALHSTATVYIKIKWMWGSGTYIKLGAIFEVGTGSDGSGTLTNAYTSYAAFSTTPSSSYNKSTQLEKCYIPGKYSAMLLGNLSGDYYTHLSSFAFGRTLDPATGDATGKGFFFYFPEIYYSTTIARLLAFTYESNTFTSTSNYSFVPGNVINSHTPGYYPAYKHWVRVGSENLSVPYGVTVGINEVAAGTVFRVNFDGTIRTYKRLSNGTTGFGNATNGHGLAILWE